MKGGLRSSLQFDRSIDTDEPMNSCGLSIDTDDSIYLCGLSTIFVASIQELKDRISHMEDIFCRQLFPTFQTRLEKLQIRLLEGRKAADDEWKKRESSLLHQIEELRHDKQCAQEQIQKLRISLEQSKTTLINDGELLKKYEYDKQLLLNKVEILQSNQERAAMLKEQLDHKTDEVVEGKELQGKLLKQIELKDQELLIEQSKRKAIHEECERLKDLYKKLKSERNYLLYKRSDSKESKTHSERMKEDRSFAMSHLSERKSQDFHHEDQDTASAISKPIELKIEDGTLQKSFECNRDTELAQPLNASSCIKPSSTSATHPPRHAAKSEPSVGLKRSASCWRDTRARQEPGGADPHDDFLDTPLERVRTLNVCPHEEVQDLPVLAPNDMDFNNSDDETQDITNTEDVRQRQQISVLGPAADKGFKYVEPVRKKAERENLQGIECKQCKKFYDAVLPHDNTTNGHKSMRCEHQDGVSRHRYRYAPPMTPEGFWNIGFESDL